MGFTSTLRYGLLGLALTAIAAPASAFGIGLQPTTVEISVQPGDRQRQVINLGNVHQEDTISLTLGLADWALDEAGQIQLTPPGDSDTSAANWVRFSPAFVTLRPGETEQIIVDMAAPIRVDREGPLITLDKLKPDPSLPDEGVTIQGSIYDPAGVSARSRHKVYTSCT